MAERALTKERSTLGRSSRSRAHMRSLSEKAQEAAHDKLTRQTASAHEYSHLQFVRHARPRKFRQGLPLWEKGYDIKEILAQALSEHATPFTVLTHTSDPREDSERFARIEHQVGEIAGRLKALGAIEEEHYRHVVDRVAKLEDRRENEFVREVLQEDPYLKWCRDNAEQLREIHERLGPCFLAIDIAKGEVVIAAQDEAEYVGKLEQLDPETRKSLYRVHSSML